MTVFIYHITIIFEYTVVAVEVTRVKIFNLPALIMTIHVLIAFTIVDIFLFIYFLHYITQTVKYETIIHRIHDNTIASIKTNCLLDHKPSMIVTGTKGYKINAFKYYLIEDTNFKLHYNSKKIDEVKFIMIDLSLKFKENNKSTK